MKNRSLSLRMIVMVGLMAALVCATSGLRIKIPLPVDKAAVHLGNVMCVLSGLLLGPAGGLASGIGSMFYDLFDPVYAPEALITLFNKFFIGFVAGLISHWRGRDGMSLRRNAAAGIAGSVTYVVLYMGKSWLEAVYLYGLQSEQARLITMGAKLITSLTNGVIAVAVAVPLAAVLQRALRRSGLAPLAGQQAR